MNITLLDNFDSFTYNLVDQLQGLGHGVAVYRNDVSVPFLAQRLLTDPKDQLLVLSPGPGNPSSAGNMMDLLQAVAGKVPVLGICLGHQALVQHYGGVVARAPVIVHGKSSRILHSGKGVFNQLPSPLSVARYHSLIAISLPNCLQVIAHTEDALTMAVSHRVDVSIGFQFHPESILTTDGQTLLNNTISLIRKRQHECDMDALTV